MAAAGALTRQAHRPHNHAVRTEHLDGRPLIQNLYQLLKGLTDRAFALNAFAPIASTEPEALGFQNIVELLESFDAQFQALEKAVGLAPNFSCPVTSSPQDIRMTADYSRFEQPAEESSEESSEEVFIQKPSGERYADPHRYTGSHKGNDQASNSSTSYSSRIMAFESDTTPKCPQISSVDTQFYSEPQPDVDRTSDSSMPNLDQCFRTIEPQFGNTQGLPAKYNIHAAPQTSSLSTCNWEYVFNTVIPISDNPQDSLQTVSDYATGELGHHYFNTMIPTSDTPQDSLQTVSDYATGELGHHYFNTMIPTSDTPQDSLQTVSDYATGELGHHCYNTFTPLSENTQTPAIDSLHPGSDYANSLSTEDLEDHFNTLRGYFASTARSGF
ncbi:MAG: hypothetical protein LQ343_001002 [Gyalolechia ehrenbergii]|nr:MAG: hypothetical protein LQ343_001002 [Gyalolechia ehrenbergii]